MPEVNADEIRVEKHLTLLRDWKNGPRKPEHNRFEATIALLIERLEELREGDNDWEDV